MPSGTIDSLEIEISATSAQAEAKIEKLVNSLNTLKTALGGNTASGLKEIAESMNTLRDSLKFRVPQSLTKSLAAFGDAVKSIDTSKISAFAEATKGLAGLEKIKLSKNLPNTIAELAQTVDQISDHALERLNAVTTSLGRLQNVNLRGFSQASARQTAGAGGTKSSVSSITASHKDATKAALSFIRTGIGNYFQRMTQPARNLAKRVSEVASAFKHIAFYRFVRTVIKEITEAVATGVNNLYQWSNALGENFSANMDSAATSMLYFKNSIGAAIAPILNALIPALNALIDKIVEAINWINQLFAKLSGASSWYKAKRVATEYANSAKKAGAAAKEALKYLAPFDELNVLPDDKSGGGGGGASDLDYSEMFDKVGLDEKFAWIDEVKAKLAQLFEPFQKAWENEGQNTIDSIKRAFNAVIELAASIGRSFEEVWLNGTGQQTLETWLRIIQNLSGIVENLANNFRIAWDEGGRGTQIVQNLWDAFNNVLSLIEDITSSTKEWSKNLDFGPLLSSVVTITGGIKELSKTLSGPLKTVWDKVLLPFASFLIEQLIPKIGTLVGKFLSLAAAIGDKLNPVVEDALKKYWEPFARFVEDTLIVKIESLTSTIDFLTHAIKDDVDQEDELYQSTHLLHEVFEDLYKPVKDVFDIFGDLWSIFFDINHLIFADLNPNVTMSNDAFSAFKTTIEFLLGPLESLHNALQFIKDVLDKIVDAANRASESLSNAIRNKSKFDTNTTTSGNSSSGGGRVFDKVGRIIGAGGGTFATGGFPEDGLFWANHNELVGRFSNGKTAVANNDQIVAGISAGVEDANESVVTAIYSAATQIVNAIRESGGGSDVDWNYVAQRVSRAQRSNARAMGTA